MTLRCTIFLVRVRVLLVELHWRAQGGQSNILHVVCEVVFMNEGRLARIAMHV